jgi:hypothetical protein
LLTKGISELKLSGPRIVGNSINQVSQDVLGIATPNCIANQWAMVLGYFRPSDTGIWSIRIECDGMSFLWIGNSALRTFTESDTDILKNDNYDYRLVTGAVNVTAGQYYPIRYIYGNEQYNCARFKIYLARPQSSRWFSDLTDLVFFPDSNSALDTWNIPPIITATQPSSVITAASVKGWSYIGWWRPWFNSSVQDIEFFEGPADFRGISTEFNGLSDIVPMETCAANVSLMLLTYFTAPNTGYWGVRAFYDDNGYMWVGSDALNNYTIHNAFISATRRGLYSQHMYLEEDKEYPIRVAYGNGVGCANFYFHLAAPYGNIWSEYEDYMNTFSNSDILNSDWSLPPLDSANITEFTNSLSIYANVSGIVTKYYFPGPENYYDRFLNRWYRVARGQLWSMTLETYASIGFGSIVMPDDQQLGVLRTAVRTPFNNGSSSYFLIVLPNGEYLQVAEVSTYTTAGSRVMIGSSA